MSTHQASDKFNITLAMVTELIAEQLPQWAHLPIQAVIPGGWDNKTFRLGAEMLIRLPSAAIYAAQVQKEQHWLPRLAPHLSLPIPKLLAMGQASKHYPWNWSVYRWMEGECANLVLIDDLPLFAASLAQFLKELYQIDPTDGPIAGAHNFYRGASPSVYDAETRSAVAQLKALIDVNAVTSLWEKAICSKWTHLPVWIHGDFSAGNILVKDGKLSAIIDFGCMGVGDPACDLVIAWTLLTKESREIFKSHLALDPDTWARARGWAVWKAMITLVSLENKTGVAALQQKQIIDEVLND